MYGSIQQVIASKVISNKSAFSVDDSYFFSRRITINSENGVCVQKYSQNNVNSYVHSCTEV